MCEIITILMAVLFTAVWYRKIKSGIKAKNLFKTALIFWGASLMWLVDCFVNVFEGASFFDISTEDFYLGLIIALSGITLFIVLNITESRKGH